MLVITEELTIFARLELGPTDSGMAIRLTNRLREANGENLFDALSARRTVPRDMFSLLLHKDGSCGLEKLR